MADLLLKQFGEQQLAGFFLVLARVSPLFLMAGETVAPVR